MSDGGPVRVADTPPEPDPFLAHPVARWLLGRRHRLKDLDRRRPWLLDSVTPLAVLLFSLPEFARENWVQDGRVVAACAAALLIPLWWRRRAPSGTFVVIVVILLAQWCAGFWLSTGVSVLVVLYDVALRSPVRMVFWSAGITTAQLTFALYGLRPLAEHRLATLLLLLGTSSAALIAGLAMRTLTAYLTAQADRNAWLETERDQRAQLAASAERARIAREMHDMVGHHVSIMIGLADGGATLATNRGEGAAEPLQLIAATGRQALDDLRRVLGVLREETGDPQLSPQPGIADLERLLPSLRAAGLRVGYRTTGELHRLASGLQLTVYRIVQESLTNTLKHAGPGASAQVTIDAGQGAVSVRIDDSGPGAGEPVRGDVGSTGHGIVGIRERAGLYGGTVTAGLDSHGGWTVDVTLNEERA